MIPWLTMCFIFLSVSVVSIAVFGLIGIVPIAIIYLSMAYTAYSTLDMRYKALCWFLVVPDKLMYYSNRLSPEMHRTLANLMIDYPQLSEPIITVMDSCTHRKRIMQNLPIMYPKGLAPHVINYLNKQDLLIDVNIKTLMLDVLKY